MSKKRPPSQRQLRAGETIRHALGETFIARKLDEPGLDTATITVTEVEITPDLKLATAWVRPLMDKDAEGLEERLNAVRRRIRGLITPRLRGMKYMPALRFRLDPAADQAARIDELLRDPKVARDLNKNPQDNPNDED